MSSQGSAGARLRRAVATGNPLLVTAAAAEMPRVGLADALGVLLVYARAGDERFGRAAARWAARYCREAPGPLPSDDEAQLVLAALRAIGGTCAGAGVEALRELAAACGMRDVRSVLDDVE